MSNSPIPYDNSDPQQLTPAQRFLSNVNNPTQLLGSIPAPILQMPSQPKLVVSPELSAQLTAQGYGPAPQQPQLQSPQASQYPKPVMPPVPKLTMPQQPKLVAPAGWQQSGNGDTAPTSPNLNMTPSMPQIADAGDNPNVARIPTQAENDQSRLNYLKSSGSGIDQIKNPLLRGLARVGDITADAVAGFNPVARIVLSNTPGTTMNHNRLVNQEEGRVNQDQAQEQQAAQTQNLNLQPQLKQQAAALAQEKQHNLEQHQSDVLDQTTQHQKDTYGANLAAHGFAQNEDGTLRPLRYEEMSETQQAVHDLKSAQEEQAEATAAMKKAQNDPSSPTFRLAEQRLAVARQNAATAQGRLGLSGQEFAFNQDKFYNPQPTAAERGKGDLAQSAIERVHEMRGIVAKHPEYFGPGAGRGTQFQAWLGSQDPDAHTFLSASQYLADHSAGVFGGRGQYITQVLHGLTDPKSNPAALNAALDEAERSAQGFVSAGRTHGKGETSGYGQSSAAQPGPAQQETKIYQGHTYVKGASGWQLQQPAQQ